MNAKKKQSIKISFNQMKCVKLHKAMQVWEYQLQISIIVNEQKP